MKKLRYSPETELINNFDKKSRFRFDCKNTTFCEHHKYNNLGWIFSRMIQLVDHFFFLSTILKEPQIDWTLFLRKHLSGVVSNLELIPQTQQNENKIAYECKANENLKWATNKFSNEQKPQEKLQQNNFLNYFTFSLTEINRTPRSLLQQFQKKANPKLLRTSKMFN